MALFPFTQPGNEKTLIAQTGHLYKISFLPVLPLSIIATALTYFICCGKSTLPLTWQNYYLKIAMAGVIVLIVLAGMIFKLMDNIAKDNKISYLSLLTFMGEKFLSYIGGILSTLLFPVIVLGIGTGLYFFLFYSLIHDKNIANLAIYSLIAKLVIAVCVLAVWIPKIFTPILVMSDGLDANGAIEESARLVKNKYLGSFVHVLCALALMVICVILFSLIPQNILVYIPLALLCISIVLPLSFALLLTYQYDLKAAKPFVLRPEDTKRKEEAVKKIKTGGDVNF